MPYIKQERRDFLDENIVKLSESVGINEGELNYAITKLVLGCLEIEGIVNYEILNKYVGVLDSVKSEFYRRKVAPYEDDKIKENGDVYQDIFCYDKW